MFNITDKHIDFILDDIKVRGVVLDDLQDNLLDHMCCIIEEEMSESEDFHQYYESLVPRFFEKELKELQVETDNLLTFKNYYAMKNTLKYAGLASAILTLLGAALKTLHLPGAGITYFLGGLLFCLVFMPLMIVLKFRDEEKKKDKWVYSIGFILGMMVSLGIVLKIMSWPGANILMRWGLTFFVFGYVPLYYLTRLKDIRTKFNITVNAVLMMACGGMLYSLYDLKIDHKRHDDIRKEQISEVVFDFEELSNKLQNDIEVLKNTIEFNAAIDDKQLMQVMDNLTAAQVQIKSSESILLNK